ncbi:hypothetical protein ACFL45_02525 [Candidatus Neomarinimicrobiota bacterium]
MIKIGKYILLAGMAVLCVGNCALFNPDQEKKDRIEQEFLFEFNYTGARGYENEGFYIDYEGQVIFYRYDAGRDAPWEPEDFLHPTTEELLEKYNHFPQQVRVIDPDTLYAQYLLIHEAAAGTYSERVNTGADIGSYAYICYVYHVNRDQYDAIYLDEWGDSSYENLSPAADSLVSWLETIITSP